MVLAAASAPGRIAARAFALGMGISSSFVVVASEQLFDWWTLVPILALLAAGGLHAVSTSVLRRSGE